MTTPVVLVLVLFVVQTLIAPTVRYFNATGGPIRGLGLALGPRDQEPPLPVYGARAAKALGNMHEALPVFIALALLNITNSSDTGSALTAAWVFLGARVLYVPAYLVGIVGLRSAVWSVAFGSLIAMAIPLFSERTIVRESVSDSAQAAP
jgi:uncharacterized MAPEG superfamily protein